MIKEPVKIIPVEIQEEFKTRIEPADSDWGAWRLVDIEITSKANVRLVVNLVDENGQAVNTNVGFAFSTAPDFVVSPDFTWLPPVPQKARIEETDGGRAELILGADGVVKSSAQGGVSVFVFDPRYPSDVVSGCGMRPNHEGMRLTFQLQRPGVSAVDVPEKLSELEARLAAVEQKLGL